MLRQSAEPRCIRCAVRQHPPDALLRQTMLEQIGQACAGLTASGFQGRNAVAEMEWKARLRAGCQQRRIPWLWIGCRQGDVPRHCPTAGNELAHPAERFESLAAWVGTGDHLRRRQGNCACRPPFTRQLFRAWRRGTGPKHPRVLGEHRQQVLPDRRDIRQGGKLDCSEQPASQSDPSLRRKDKVRWGQGSDWQSSTDPLFQEQQVCGPRAAGCQVREGHASLPCSPKGA